MSHRKRLLVSGIAVTAIAASLTGCRSSASSENGDASDHPSMTIMVGGIDKVIYLPAKLAEDLGYFKDSGVDVTLNTEPSGASAEDMLVANQVEGVVGFYDHSITLQAAGKCVESVVQLAKVPGEAEVVTNDSGITSPADFSGKKLGVTSPGSSTDYLTQYLATKNGVDTSDYTTVTAGAGSTFVAAMQNGGIDGGMTTDPTIAQITKQGLGKVLLDMRTEEGTKAALGGLYPAASLYMDCDYVEQNPETVQKVADAFVKSLQYISSHSAADIASHMPEDYNGGDPALYQQSIEDSMTSFTDDGVMPEGGPETVLDVLGTFNPDVEAKKDDIDLSKTYTTQFVENAG
jgi:NitT/TauT family transport system substrate-binding protein